MLLLSLAGQPPSVGIVPSVPSLGSVAGGGGGGGLGTSIPGILSAPLGGGPGGVPGQGPPGSGAIGGPPGLPPGAGMPPQRPGAPGGDMPAGSGGEPSPPPLFLCPRRPNIGTDGRVITLRANHFQITMPRGFLHHYDVTITPDKCPRKINREIIETMVQAYSKIFSNQKPVFDGRKNMYTRDDLPIGRDKVELEVTLPGEGKDRVFRVAIKWISQVSCVLRVRL